VPPRPSKTEGCYLCRACGCAQPLWTALCHGCGVVGTLTFEEGKLVEEFGGDDESRDEKESDTLRGAVPLGSVVPSEREVIPTHIPGLDRILEGGLTREIKKDGTRSGTSVLLWGTKGGGKTRLALQILSGPARRSGLRGARYKCSFISGEEDEHRIARYAQEMNVSKKVGVLATHDLNYALQEAAKADLTVLDSVQQLADPDYSGAIGSARQVHHVVQRVLDFVKTHPTVVILLSQVTTTGEAKGGSSLGHDTDVSLKVAKYGGEDRAVLIAGKNRFGSATGVWRFRIEEHGLVDREKKMKRRKENFRERAV